MSGCPQLSARPADRWGPTRHGRYPSRCRERSLREAAGCSLSSSGAPASCHRLIAEPYRATHATRSGALKSASVAKVTVRLSARRQTATARAGHAAGSCPPHPVEHTNQDRQPGEYDAPSNRVLPGPALVSTHQPPVPATRRPAVHREPAPPRARATPRPSRTRAADRHAPRICHAERHLTSGVAGPGTCAHARVPGQSCTPVMPPAPPRRAPVTSPGPRAQAGVPAPRSTSRARSPCRSGRRTCWSAQRPEIIVWVADGAHNRRADSGSTGTG